MKLLGKLKGRSSANPGPGRPRSQIMERRAILVVVVVILVGFVIWWGVQQEEKSVYFGGSRPEQIPTAAGKPERP